MIATVFHISWLNLKRDRVAQMIMFLLPIAFFTIFAWFFGGMGGGMPAVRVIVVDEDHTDLTQRIIAALEQESSLRITLDRSSASDATPKPYARDEAIEQVKNGNAPVALIFPDGFSEAFGFFGLGAGEDHAACHVELHADQANPFAGQIVAGMLQKVAMTAAPDVFMQRGMDMFKQYGGPLSDQQQMAIGNLIPMLRRFAVADADGSTAVLSNKDNNETSASPQAAPSGSESDAAQGPAFSGIIGVETFSIAGEQESKDMISYQAAGTAVLFLLFATVAGGGVLLEEEKAGVLERLLCSRLSMGQLLLGKWLFIAVTGFAQLMIMFVYAALVFNVPLWSVQRLTGFLVITVFTAGAAAAFGICFATIVRSRAQLDGIATIFILVMSAVGGSMFPRFLMPESMQKLGYLTFNAWAIDGYQQIFWYDKGVAALWSHVAVLGGITLVLLALARRFARRWEMV